MRRLVVVGASLAGLRAAQAARKAGFDGDLVMIGEERHRPYTRPPLSKELLAGEHTVDRVHLPSDELGAEWRLGVPAAGLEPGAPAGRAVRRRRGGVRPAGPGHRLPAATLAGARRRARRRLRAARPRRRAGAPRRLRRAPAGRDRGRGLHRVRGGPDRAQGGPRRHADRHRRDADAPARNGARRVVRAAPPGPGRRCAAGDRSRRTDRRRSRRSGRALRRRARARRRRGRRPRRAPEHRVAGRQRPGGRCPGSRATRR